MTVRQSRYSVLQDVSLVVVRAQCNFTVVDGLDLVRTRTKHSVCSARDSSISQRSQIHVVLQMFTDVSLLYTLGRSFQHAFIVGEQAVHFRPQADEFQRRFAVAFVFHLTYDFHVYCGIQG